MDKGQKQYMDHIMNCEDLKNPISESLSLPDATV